MSERVNDPNFVNYSWTNDERRLYEASKANESDSPGASSKPHGQNSFMEQRFTPAPINIPDADAAMDAKGYCRGKNPPKAPPGVNVEEELQKARENCNPVWFYNMVNTGKPWDFKRHFGREYAAFGNYFYGRAGKEFCYGIGFPDQALYRGAGYQSWKSPNHNPAWGHPIDGPPYGDDPMDQECIKRGIEGK